MGTAYEDVTKVTAGTEAAAAREAAAAADPAGVTTRTKTFGTRKGQILK